MRLNLRTLLMVTGIAAAMPFVAHADDPAPAASPAPAADAAPSVPAKPRTVDEILHDLDTLKIPEVPKGKFDADIFEKHLNNRKETVAKMIAVPMELYTVAPTHERISAAMHQRWSMMITEERAPQKVIEETDRIRQESKDPQLVATAYYWNAIGIGVDSNYDYDKTIAAVDRFIEKAPDDVRGSYMLVSLGNRWVNGNADKAMVVLRRAKEKYPGSEAAQQADVILKDIETLGKPFELKFKDAVTGEEIDFQTKFKGKVVVVDFWATWCRPCIAELPKLKDLYKKHHGEGFDVVAISLDSSEEQGGKAKLLDFIGKNELTWYHYYQGNGWESEFSRNWGVTSIPRVFLVVDGKLVSKNARANLVAMAEQELAKLKAGK